ncbi:MAG: toluene tolerance protein [Candidatus Pelagibacter sp.]|nr:MAG: toluene tolerance protein [Candidatus Pelagibacter sp.]
MLTKNIIKFFLLVSINFCFISNSFAITPYLFVQETADEATEALNKRLSKEEKMEKLKIIAKKTVDVKGIGNYSLGAYRKTISDQQKDEYFEIFEQYFLKSFASRLAEYTDPKIRVDSQKKLNDKYTMVSSTLLATSEKAEIKIDWRVVTKNPDNPLIIDVIIEGVSLAKVQREEFNSIIQSNDGNINALFKTLREFVENK